MEMSALSRTDILTGWKDISSYLRLGVRTVQRYEKFGLPVRRPAGMRRGSVIATKPELDRWITARPISDAFRLPVSRPAASSTWADFKAGIAEMKRLRTEMTRLRTEAVISLEALYTRLVFMQGLSDEKLPQFANSRRRRPGNDPLFSVDAVPKMLALDSYQRRAS
jgi:hypothetical protein